MGVRRGAAVLFVLVTVLLAAVHAPGRAEAAITAPFSVRFDVNTNGSILLRGNSNLTCPTLNAGCASARNGSASGTGLNNNSFTMVATDADGDPLGTFNDSLSAVTLPSGSSVLFAGLYWGADSSLAVDPANRNKVLFRTPAAAWQTITATSLYASGGNYQGFADVTALVAAGGNGNYGVANIQMSLAGGQYAGWSLAIAYRNPAEDLRSLRIYDGFGALNSGNLVIPITGFETPHSGVVHARIGAVAYEGDRGTTGDSFNVDGNPLSDAANPATNFFNSSATDGGVPYAGRDPPYDNLLGFDIDQVDATGLFGHAATSTTLTLTTTGDAYYPGVITFSIDLYAPKILTTMTGTDVNGGDLVPGDEIEYRIAVRNDGNDTADGVVLSDAIPPYTTYVPGSLTVQGGPVTDATGDDAGWYAAGTAGWTLGSIPYQGTTYVTLRVRVAAGAPAGYAITNLVNVSYTGHTTSVNVAGLGGAVATPVLQPHPDRAGAVVVTPTFVQRAAAPNAITYTATVTNAAGDLEPNAGVQLTLPAGVTPGTLPAACSAAGQVVTCSLGPLAAGSSANVSIPALAGAATGTTAVATVLATGTGADGNPANDTGTASLRVNSPPVAQPDSASTTLGTAVNVRVRDNDSDPEDTPGSLLVSITSPPAHGTAVVEADQTVTYTPAAKWGGADPFTYQLDDQHGGTTTAVATVTTANAVPTGYDDMDNTGSNTPVDVDVLGNDRDPNDDPLVVTGVTQPPAGQGLVTFTPSLVTFQPTVAFHGLATFTYSISDGHGGTATATVKVDVANAAPTAGDDAVSVPFAGGAPVLIQVLDNDSDPNGDNLTITTGPPTPATATLTPTATGVLLTTPATFSGVVTFSYTVDDGHLGTATARATVTVRNAPPAAAAFTRTTPYRTPFTIDVVTPGTDPNGDPLRVSGGTDPAHGTVVRNPTGTITYLPDVGFSGADSFTYTLDDGNGGTATATVTVTVGNGVAVARADSATAPGGVPVVIDVLANDDNDPNGDPLTVTTGPGPTSGTVSVGADRRITYTPNASFLGTDTFRYQLDDGNGGVTSADVTVTVINLPPTAQPDAASTDTDTLVTIPVLAGDADPNGDPLTLSTVGGAANGTTAVGAGNTAVYTPNAGFCGTDSFLYTVTDPLGLADSAIVTITVRNAPPVAVADAITVLPDVATTLPLLANDHDPNTGQALRVSSVTAAGKGTASLSGGTVTYRSVVGATGTDTFTYVLVDDAGGTATATVTLTINGPPVAIADSAVTPWATAVDIPVTSNDTDPDSDLLTVSAVGTPAHGVASVNADGTVRYRPDVAFVGTDTFGYTVRDPLGHTASAQISVVVSTAAPPLAVPDSRATPYLQTANIAVLVNDVDPTGSLQITAVTQPAHGTATFTNSLVTYVPPVGFSGLAQFTYTATDVLGVSSTAQVSVTVGNAVAVARDDTATVAAGVPLPIDVLANDDDDPNGDPLTMTTGPGPANGTASVGADRRITYAPDPGFVGIDTFHYQLDDRKGGVAGANVTVTVVNLPPVAQPDAASTDTNTPVPITVLTGDTDPNGDPLTVTAAVGGIHGTTTVGSAGTVTYTPDAGYSGTDTFRYTVADPLGLTDTAIVTVVVRNAPPIAVDDLIMVLPDVPTPLPLLANDHDANTSQTLRVSSVSAAHRGTVSLSGGVVTYRSPAGATGPDTFTYEVVDDAGDTGTATVTLLINGPPVALDDTTATWWATPVDIVVLANDTDPDADPLTVSSVGAAAHGSVGLNPDGSIHYQPFRTYRGGVDSFGYAVRDDVGHVVPARASVLVRPPALPAARPDQGVTPYRRSVTIPVLANDLDVTGSLQVTNVTQPARGEVTFSSGSVTYTPPDGFSGMARFNYTATDELTQDSTAEVVVIVGPPPTAPDKAVVGTPDAAVGITPPAQDGSGHSIIVRRIGKPAHGTAVLNADGTITYTPDPGWTGTDSFTYEVVDEDGNVAMGSIIVVVPARTSPPTPSPTPQPPTTSPTPHPSRTSARPTTSPPTTRPPPSRPPANSPPIAVGDAATVVAGDSVVLRPLLNDHDPDGDPLRITAITNPDHGAAMAGADGVITYAAGSATPGMIDSFGYTVADGRGGTASATVTVRIAAAADLPTTGQNGFALIRAGLLAATAGGLLYWLGGRGPESRPEHQPDPS